MEKQSMEKQFKLPLIKNEDALIDIRLKVLMKQRQELENKRREINKQIRSLSQRKNAKR